MAYDPVFYVIAKTYDDEPRRLWATVEDGSLLVAGETKEAWIGYAPELIFQYDDATYTDLRRAFAAGAADKLARLWRAARPAQIAELAS